ncbi:MAG: type II secretion system F family protein [Actinomycetes bacterium]
MTIAATCVSVAFVVGMLLVRSWWSSSRRTFVRAVAPFVGAVEINSPVNVVARKVLSTLFIHRSFSPWGSDRHISELLRAEGQLRSLGMFRSQQLFLSTSAFAIAGVWSVLRSVTHDSSPGLGMFITMTSLPLGGWYATWVLKNRVAKRAQCADDELPDLLELLAFAVSAGEPFQNALTRVCDMTSGVLSQELKGNLAMVKAGASLTAALTQVKNAFSSELVARAMRAMVVALERGTPIAEVLRAQASDARAAHTRYLLVLAGKKESAMLAPVVFFVLPMIVAVAIYPGLIAMRVL